MHGDDRGDSDCNLQDESEGDSERDWLYHSERDSHCHLRRRSEDDSPCKSRSNLQDNLQDRLPGYWQGDVPSYVQSLLCCLPVVASGGQLVRSVRRELGQEEALPVIGRVMVGFGDA